MKNNYSNISHPFFHTKPLKRFVDFTPTARKFGLATFQGFNSCMWPVISILNSGGPVYSILFYFIAYSVFEKLLGHSPLN